MIGGLPRAQALITTETVDPQHADHRWDSGSGLGDSPRSVCAKLISSACWEKQEFISPTQEQYWDFLKTFAC